MYLCDKGSILVLPIEYVKKIIKERMFIMNSKNKKIIKERMFTMNLKKKIFSRIAAGVMTVAMAITLLPGTMKTVNAAEPVTSASLDVNLYKRADVYAPNTTFEFEVTNLTAEQAKATNGGKDLKPPFKNAPAGAVKPGTIELAPAAEDLTETSISKKLTFTLVADKFTTEGIGTYRYKVKQKEGTYEGIKYDVGERYLDVTVATDGTNFYIASASLVLYQEDGQLVKSGAFVNTYGVNKPDTENPVPKPDGTVNDLVISKTVTGNYGERDKKFIFEITINGAEGEWYNLEGQPAIKKGTAARIELKHGDTVKIYGLTENDTYTIKELEADDYKTTFETKLNGTNKAGGSGNIKTATGTIDAGTSLQTQEVAFTNDRTGSATGFASSYGPYALMVVLAGAVAFVLFRKKRAEY